MKKWFATLGLGVAMMVGGIASADTEIQDMELDAAALGASYTCYYAACKRTYSGYGSTESQADSAAERSCRQQKFNCNEDCSRRSCRSN